MRATDALLLGVLIIAMVMDLRTGKIRNWLTLPAIACGPLLNLIDGGKAQAVLSLYGMGVMALVAAVLISLCKVGAGDAKLLVAVGSLGRLPIVTSALLYTGLAGGALALLVLLRAFGPKAVFRDTFSAVWTRLRVRISGPGIPGGKMRLPYAIPIGIGSAAALFWRL